MIDCAILAGLIAGYSKGWRRKQPWGRPVILSPIPHIEFDRTMLMRLLLSAALLLVVGLAQAEVYDLPDEGDDLIGKIEHIEAKEEDTFVALARRHNVGYVELQLANPEVDAWLPGEGRSEERRVGKDGRQRV